MDLGTGQLADLNGLAMRFLLGSAKLAHVVETRAEYLAIASEKNSELFADSGEVDLLRPQSGRFSELINLLCEVSNAQLAAGVSA